MKETINERGTWTSASSAAADELCQGRHIAQRGMPERKTDDSDFGDKVHEALKTDDPSKLDHEQLKVYEQCVEIRGRMIDKYFGNDAPNVKVSKERRFWCQILAKPGDKSPTPHRFKHSGQVDWIARLGKRALIVEYKALPGDVASSPTNKQLRDQVVLAAGEMVLSEVATVVVQPLVTQNPELCVYQAEHIKRAEAEMFTRVRNSNNPDAPRTANATSCKFCLARDHCAAYQVWVTAMVPKSEIIAATPVEQWTPEMRSHFLTMRPAVEQWLKECYSKLKALMKEQPTAVPGFKLKKGNTVTEINDPQELFNRFAIIAKDWAAKEADPQAAIMAAFMKCVTIGNGDFEKVVRMVTGLKGKALESAVDKLREGLFDSSTNDQSITKDT